MPARTPDPQVIPYLLYADAGAAMDWLIKTFGFTERVRDRRGNGTVRHGELVLDNGGVIMLGSPGPDFRRLASLQRRHQLAVAFAAYEARNFAGVPAVDRDPATYVREAEEEEGQEPRSGSLSIGSLKQG